MIAEYEYPELRRVVYGEDRASFLPVCPKCGRFVKPHSTITFGGDDQPKGPNADCKRCGPVEMPFEGYV